MQQILKQSLLLVLFLLIAPVIAAASDGNLTPRDKFLEAEKALRYKQTAKYYKLKNELREQNYILYPYLQFAELRKLMAQPDLPSKHVRRFLQTEKDTVLADRMRTIWLNHLIKKKKWSDYVKDYQPTDNVALQCYDIYARYKTKKDSNILNEAASIWVYGKSRPRECDVLFSAWEENGGLTENLVWDRIHLAMDSNQFQLIKYLKRYLPEDQQALIDTWMKVYRSPDIVTSKKLFKENIPFLRDTQIYGLKRLTRSSPEKAIKLWNKIKDDYTFTNEQKYDLYRSFALHLAMDHQSGADKWFAMIPKQYYDNTLYEWEIRNALRQGNWKQVVTQVNTLPANLHRDPTWQYWLARAYEQTGNTAKASSIYKELSKQRHFHALMASDRENLDYSLSVAPAQIKEDDVVYVSQVPGIQRSLELQKMGRNTDARREWSYTIQSLNEPQLQAAAYIAYENGMYDRAIVTLAKADNQDNLAIRFPRAYQKTIESEAKRQGINPAWVYAVARRESAFVPDARSPAGAVGLMQVMPYTARQIAREINEPYFSQSQLLNLNKNVRLGSAYLRKLYREMNGNIILATASYNAGPHRVKKWLPKRGKIAPDVWIETMPFYETREYVKAVLVYRMIYLDHMGKSTRLDSVLEDISYR